MASTVKNVFFLIMFVVIAAILYLAFFGWNTKVTDTTYETSNSNIGVLGFMSVAVEGSISSYYNEYVFLPAAKTGNSLSVRYLGITDYSDNINLADTFGLYTTSSSPVVSGDVKAVYTTFYCGTTNTKVNYE